MAFNWKSVTKALNAFTSPKQAINWMLEQGAKKDPQMAANLKRMMTSGENPAKVLIQLSSTGQITIKQLNQIKNYYSIARKFGLKQQIPTEVWSNAQKAIEAGANAGSQSKPPVTNKSKFTGF